MKLVRIARTPEYTVFFAGSRNGEVSAINPTYVQNAHEAFSTLGEFFMLDDRDVDRVVQALAEADPGKEVQVYSLEQVAVCPAAALVRKKVTKDGVLPL